MAKVPTSTKPVTNPVASAKPAVAKPAAAKPVVVAAKPAPVAAPKPAVTVAAPAPKVELPKVEAPKAEAPKADAVTAVAAKPEPKVETPAAAAPVAASAPMKGNTMNETITNAQASIKTAAEDMQTRATEMFGDMNTRAKDAMSKGTKAIEELVEFSKGNVEAIVASGRVAAKGAEEIAKYSAEYGRTRSRRPMRRRSSSPPSSRRPSSSSCRAKSPSRRSTRWSPRVRSSPRTI